MSRRVRFSRAAAPHAGSMRPRTDLTPADRSQRALGGTRPGRQAVIALAPIDAAVDDRAADDEVTEPTPWTPEEIRASLRHPSMWHSTMAARRGPVDSARLRARRSEKVSSGLGHEGGADVTWLCRNGGPNRMHCPFCKNDDTRVVDSRLFDEGQAIRRRRSCGECGRRFTTVESAVLAVVKRNGVTEPFSREKVMKGVRRACQGREVSEDQLQVLAQRVEDAVRATGQPEIPSNEVGLAILGPLRDLDEVAYLRFASVYQAFSSLEDFENAIGELRTQRGSVVSN